MTLKEVFSIMKRHAPVECKGIDYNRITKVGWELNPKTNELSPYVELEDSSLHSYTFADPQQVYEIQYCFFCGGKIKGKGCDASPIYEGRCCISCYNEIIMPAKLDKLREERLMNAVRAAMATANSTNP